MSKLDTILITKSNSEAALKKFKQSFKTVHYFPDNETIPQEVLAEAEMLFTGGGKFASSIKSLKDVPNLRHIQMASAGANGILGSQQMKEFMKEKGGREISLAGASGTHVLSIPNYVVAMVITLYHQLQTQIILARVSEPPRPFNLLLTFRTRRDGSKGMRLIIPARVFMRERRLGGLLDCWVMVL